MQALQDGVVSGIMIESIFPHAIDNSMRKELVKCETAALYKYIQGLRANDSAKVDLIAGKAFAAGMEAMRRSYYVAGADPMQALSLGIAAVHDEYGSFVPPPTAKKTADRVAGALAFYANECPLVDERLVPLKFPDGSVGIEISFNYPIPTFHPDTGKQLTYCGRFDMLARDVVTGSIWVVDEKTTSQMGEKWANQWPLDSQMTGYCWGANKLLDQHGLNERVAGAIINGIAIRLRDYEHARFNAYREEWEIDRWYNQMIKDVERWKRAYMMGEYDQALDHACAMYNNPCEFQPLCQSRNPERIIETSFEVKRWNPLTREES